MNVFDLSAAIEMANEGLGDEPLHEIIGSSNIRFLEPGVFEWVTPEGLVVVEHTSEGLRIMTSEQWSRRKASLG